MKTPERIHTAFLFPALVVLLVAQPVVAALTRTAPEVVAFPLLVALIASIWSLDRGGPWLRAGIATSVVLFGSALANLIAPSPRLHAVSYGASAALSMISVILGIRWLFATALITAETLLSAVSVYLMIALSFGLVYVAIYTLEPAAFRGVSPAGDSAVTADLLYYSIASLSCSALGDILPLRPEVRLLTNVESVLGQLYIAVLVALLITGYASRSRR